MSSHAGSARPVKNIRHPRKQYRRQSNRNQAGRSDSRVRDSFPRDDNLAKRGQAIQETWNRQDAVVLIAVGVLLLAYGAVGARGYIPFRKMAVRQYRLLREKIPQVYHGVSLARFYQWQSWAFICLGSLVTGTGILLLLGRP